MAIENFKILGAVLELPAKQPCQASRFASFFGELAGLAAGIHRLPIIIGRFRLFFTFQLRYWWPILKAYQIGRPKL